MHEIMDDTRFKRGRIFDQFIFFHAGDVQNFSGDPCLRQLFRDPVDGDRIARQFGKEGGCQQERLHSGVSGTR